MLKIRQKRKKSLTIRKEITEAQNKSDIRRRDSTKWENLNYRLKEI
jgi:hypothetical protein